MRGSRREGQEREEEREVVVEYVRLGWDTSFHIMSVTGLHGIASRNCERACSAVVSNHCVHSETFKSHTTQHLISYLVSQQLSPRAGHVLIHHYDVGQLGARLQHLQRSLSAVRCVYHPRVIADLQHNIK